MSSDDVPDIPTQVKVNCSTNSLNSNNLEDAESTASKEISAIEEVDVEAGFVYIQEQESERQLNQNQYIVQDQDGPVPDKPHIEQLSLEEVSTQYRWP